MEIKIAVRSTERVPVKFLRVEAGVRYWEDGIVNGVEDEDGSRIPCRNGDFWEPTIDLETGTIEGWPAGTTANIHYKVADDGRYTLLNAERLQVKCIDGYVPSIMCPRENGYGDYIIMDIDDTGKIGEWCVQLAEFEND
jgi:hypothetical protein